MLFFICGGDENPWVQLITPWRLCRLGAVDPAREASRAPRRVTASEQAVYRFLPLVLSVRVRSCRCHSFSNRKRCAGLRFGLCKRRLHNKHFGAIYLKVLGYHKQHRCMTGLRSRYHHAECGSSVCVYHKRSPDMQVRKGACVPCLCGKRM